MFPTDPASTESQWRSASRSDKIQKQIFLKERFLRGAPINRRGRFTRTTIPRRLAKKTEDTDIWNAAPPETVLAQTDTGMSENSFPRRRASRARDDNLWSAPSPRTIFTETTMGKIKKPFAQTLISDPDDDNIWNAAPPRAVLSAERRG